MTKYEIRTDTHEFRLPKRAGIRTCTGADLFEDYRQSSIQDSEVRESFDSLEEARAEFEAHWANWGSTQLLQGNGTRYLYCEFAWIEENRYDDDGEFDQGGWCYDVSAEDWTEEEDE